MNESYISLLESRISLLEQVFVGVSLSHAAVSSTDGLTQRFAAIESNLQSLEQKLPDITVCRSLVDKIAPILTMKRSTLTSILDKTKELLHEKDRLLDGINMLQAIQTHKLPNFSESNAVEIEEMKKRMVTLEALLASLASESISQMKDVDRLLQLYEESMLLLRETMFAWQSRLTVAESEAADVLSR